MAVPVPPNNQPAAKDWEAGYQGGGTVLTPMSPTLRPVLDASPEGVHYAPAGTVVAVKSGALFTKSTTADLNTGWVEAT